MQWTVKTQQSNYTVSFPSLVSPYRWFTAEIGLARHDFFMHRFGVAVSVNAAHGLTLERNVSITQKSLNTNPGEVKTALQADIRLSAAGLNLVRAEVAPWLPESISAQLAQKPKEFTLKSPMTGKVLKVLVTNGQTVSKGQDLLVVEAMKMENRITSPTDGVVEGCQVIAGVNISSGQILLKVGPQAQG